MKPDIRHIQLITGQSIITHILDEFDDHFIIEIPFLINKKDDNSTSFSLYMHLSEPNDIKLTLYKHSIVCTAECNTSYKYQYMIMINQVEEVERESAEQQRQVELELEEEESVEEHYRPSSELIH